MAKIFIFSMFLSSYSVIRSILRVYASVTVFVFIYFSYSPVVNLTYSNSVHLIKDKIKYKICKNPKSKIE